LRERYPGTDDAGLDLLKAMLKFDPTQRITVDAALAHPYLASVRNLAKEQAAARPMSAEIETIGEDPEHIHANVSAATFILPCSLVFAHLISNILYCGYDDDSPW
jgi:serine/threonine protein kinase